MCVFCLHVCVCTTGVPGALRGQNRALDPLELELEMVVGVGNQTWVFYKSNKFPDYCSCFPFIYFFAWGWDTHAQCMCRGQSTDFRSSFCASTMWVFSFETVSLQSRFPGTNLCSLGLPSVYSPLTSAS